MPTDELYQQLESLEQSQTLDVADVEKLLQEVERRDKRLYKESVQLSDLEKKVAMAESLYEDKMRNLRNMQERVKQMKEDTAVLSRFVSISKKPRHSPSAMESFAELEKALEGLISARAAQEQNNSTKEYLNTLLEQFKRLNKVEEDKR